MEPGAFAGLETVAAWQIVLLCAATFVGAVLGGVSGFGAALLIIPVLAPIVGVKGILPVLAVGMTIGNLSRAWVYRAEVHKPTVLRIGWIALPATLVGCLIYDAIPTDGLAIAIASFLIVSLILRRLTAGKGLKLGPVGLAGAGTIFGLVNGTLPGGGIVLTPVLLGLGLFGGRLIGTDAVISVGANIVRIIMFGALTLLTPTLALAGLLVGIFTIPGAFTARWMLNRLSIGVHTMIVEAMVVFGAASLLYEVFVGQAS